MANPTSNFGWQMPTNTDLVKDLPADFEVFGQAVDTSLMDLKGGTTGQVLSKASNTDMDFTWVAQDDSNAIQNALLTTTGDTIYASSASTPARLGIGTTGQVLTVSGGVPTWATPGGSGANWSLLNSGGTALTGAQTVTVSGISGKDKIMVLVSSATSATSSEISIRLNTDTGSNYPYYGIELNSPATYAATNLGQKDSTGSSIILGKMGGASEAVSGSCLITGCDSSGVKVYQSMGTGTGGTGHRAYWLGGYYNSSSTISSISLFCSGGNFNGGTVYVYTSA